MIDYAHMSESLTKLANSMTEAESLRVDIAKLKIALAERDAAIAELVRALSWAWNRDGATQDQIDHTRAILAKHARVSNGER